MAQTALRELAGLLNPAAPSRMIADLFDVPKSTAKSWARGTRRAPVRVLERLRDEARARARSLLALCNCGGEIDALIRERKQEPPRRPRGCWAPTRHISH